MRRRAEGESVTWESFAFRLMSPAACRPYLVIALTPILDARSSSTMSFAARFFASPFSRCARTISNKRISACLQAVPCQRRGIFGFGKSSPTATPLSEDELAARAKHLTQELMKKPEWKKITTHAGAMNAIQNLVTVFGKKGMPTRSLVRSLALDLR